MSLQEKETNLMRSDVERRRKYRILRLRPGGAERSPLLQLKMYL